jgi:hypothetical protein
MFCGFRFPEGVVVAAPPMPLWNFTSGYAVVAMCAPTLPQSFGGFVQE